MRLDRRGAFQCFQQEYTHSATASFPVSSPLSVKIDFRVERETSSHWWDTLDHNKPFNAQSGKGLLARCHVFWPTSPVRALGQSLYRPRW